MSPRRGVTLLELMVVLAIIGIMAAVATPAHRRRSPGNFAGDSIRTAIAAVRYEAKLNRRPVTRTLIADGVPSSVTAWPDGRLVLDALLDSLAMSRQSREVSQ